MLGLAAPVQSAPLFHKLTVSFSETNMWLKGYLSCENLSVNANYGSNPVDGIARTLTNPETSSTLKTQRLRSRPKPLHFIIYYSISWFTIV